MDIFLFIFAMLIILLYLIASFFHKMAGIELLNVYQLIFYIFILENKITSFYALFKIFTYLDMNFLYFWNHKNNFDIKNKLLKFDHNN